MRGDEEQNSRAKMHIFAPIIARLLVYRKYLIFVQQHLVFMVKNEWPTLFTGIAVKHIESNFLAANCIIFAIFFFNCIANILPI